MNLEWLLALGLFGVACYWLLRDPRTRRTGWWVAAILLVAGVAGGVVLQSQKRKQKQSELELLARTPAEGRPGGYVSSDRCQACHPAEYQSWHQSFHRTMTQHARAGAVLGNFDGVELELEGKRYELFRRDAEFWVRMDDPEHAPDSVNAPARVERRVGLMTGSHHMQAYWIPSERGNLQIIFPFAWLIEDRRWVPFHSTFLRDPAIGPYRQHWNNNCMNCHATAGQPRPNHDTLAFETRTGELGIACEACHGPAETHVRANRDPLRRYSMRDSDAPDPTIVNPARLDSKRSSQVCAHCHSINWIPDSKEYLESGLKFRPGDDMAEVQPVVRPGKLREQTFLHEGLRKNPTFLKDRYWPDGMVRVSGRDYSGMVEAPCYQRGEMSCLSCHSMHSPESPADQLAAGMGGNQACLQCHGEFASRLEAHTHHRADSSGSSCYNCHMPHTTYGLMKAIRSHQISSPSVAESVAVGRPNACNLCHLDQTLEWTGRKLKEWYGIAETPLSTDDREMAAGVMWILKGDAGQRALLAWHFGWEPAWEASGKDWQAAFLAVTLGDSYSAVRFIAHRSLKRLSAQYLGVAYDFVGSVERRLGAAEQVLQLWREQPSGTTTDPLARARLLLGHDGKLDEQRVEEVVRRRNNVSMDLQE